MFMIRVIRAIAEKDARSKEKLDAPVQTRVVKEADHRGITMYIFPRGIFGQQELQVLEQQAERAKEAASLAPTRQCRNGYLRQGIWRRGSAFPGFVLPPGVHSLH